MLETNQAFLTLHILSSSLVATQLVFGTLDGPYKIVQVSRFLWAALHLASVVRFCLKRCQTDREDILLCLLNRGALMSFIDPAGGN